MQTKTVLVGKSIRVPYELMFRKKKSREAAYFFNLSFFWIQYSGMKTCAMSTTTSHTTYAGDDNNNESSGDLVLLALPSRRPSTALNSATRRISVKVTNPDVIETYS